MDAELKSLVTGGNAKWRRESPANEASVLDLAQNGRFKLPCEYLDFLRLSDGGSGSLAVSPFWFQIWSAADVLKLNKGYGRDEFYPELFLFGSSGGGSLIAFELRDQHPWPIVSMDWYDSKRECVDKLAPDFLSFVRLLGTGKDDDDGEDVWLK